MPKTEEQLAEEHVIEQSKENGELDLVSGGSGSDATGNEETFEIVKEYLNEKGR